MAYYTLVKEIGKGGMGCVYEGRDEYGKRIAIKMLSNKVTYHPQLKDFFYAEAHALKSMSHPCVVGYEGNPYSDAQGNLYLPMEYIEGETLEQHIRRNGAYTEFDAKDMMGKILEAIAYIHSKGVIHRDIKPSNIMLRPDKSICIIDFGIVKDMKISTGQTLGRIIGTDGYMSPEQANGDSIDHRTDIYSLGCLLFYMLTGQHAIKKKKNDYETVVAILKDDFPRVRDYNNSLSENIESVIFQAVNKDMRKRFQSAIDFKRVLFNQELPKEPEAITDLNPNRNIITIGKGTDCDIRIDGGYVSRLHAEIEYVEEVITGGPTRTYLLFTDRSTNGTTFDGKYLHNASMKIPFTSWDAKRMPKILLACKDEYLLDWEKVFYCLRQKGKEITLQKVKKMNVWLGIASFLFPVVGWILWGQWKKEAPECARKAAWLGWGGFIVGLILRFCV